MKILTTIAWTIAIAAFLFVMYRVARTKMGYYDVTVNCPCKCEK